MLIIHSLSNFSIEIQTRLTLAFFNQAIFRNREQAIQTGGVEKLVLLSQSRIDAVIRIFSTVIAAFLLLVPVYILYHLQPLDPTQVKSRSLAQFCTIFGFTLLFSLVVSIVTKARRHEVFAATVAYSAVLGTSSRSILLGSHLTKFCLQSCFS